MDVHTIITSTAAKRIIGLLTWIVLPSPPTAEGLCWNMSTPVRYLFVCFVTTPTSPSSLSAGRAAVPVSVEHSPWRGSRERGGRRGERRGGFPWAGSSGRRTGPGQEPAEPRPGPRSRWPSTPPAAGNVKVQQKALQVLAAVH